MLRITKQSEYVPVQTAVTVGKFDGFHLGHRSLLSAVLKEKERGLASCVVTFSTAVDTGRKVIYTKEEQRKLCESMGIDVLAEYLLDEAMREMTAEQFVAELLCKKLQAKVIVAGEDFRFGKGREGDVALLRALEETYGYRTVCVPKVTEESVRISSTGIRGLLAEGKVAEANELLGRPYAVFGEVLHGKKLGRTLGFPTMNLIPSGEKLLPVYGVYVTRTKVDGQWFDGITNIGLRPTVDSDEQVSVETHLFSYEGDLYGKQVEVQFLTFLRQERKFPDVDSLQGAMKEDVKNAKGYLKNL
ncbi:MAG: bifunctional riboflavin kinase/FAD synthetase [Lachnospiraceae bacterium]|nr:bifunctional riboflavin kinase/FAD synthetase [Lachnospiraceae bacterium]